MIGNGLRHCNESVALMREPVCGENGGKHLVSPSFITACDGEAVTSSIALPERAIVVLEIDTRKRSKSHNHDTVAPGVTAYCILTASSGARYGN